MTATALARTTPAPTSSLWSDVAAPFRAATGWIRSTFFPPSKDVDFSEYGASGTEHAGGRIFGIDANDLSGEAWVGEAQKMWSDAAIRGGWRALKETLQSSSWKFVEGKDSARARAIRDHCNENLGLDGKTRRMTKSFEQTLDYAYEFIPIGYRYLEVLWGMADGKTWIRELADRDPSAHRKWNVTKEGRLESVEQHRRWTRKTLRPIPAEKLVHFVLDATGTNFEGRGLLRSAHMSWDLKKHTINQTGIAVIRWSSGSPVVTVNKTALRDQGYSEPEIVTFTTNAHTAVANYMSTERMWFGLPDGITLDSYGGDLEVEATEKVIELCNREISKVFLLNFLLQGASDSGGYSASRVEEHFFRRAALNFQDRIGAALMAPGGAIHQLVVANFGEVKADLMPILKHSGLDVSPLLTEFGNLPGLVTADMLRTDLATRNEIRTILGLPPEGPDAKKQETPGPVDNGRGGRPEVPATGAAPTNGG